MKKPRVLIAMASGILGGPGKGLVQFFRHGGLEGCSPLVINYRITSERDEKTDFVRAIQKSGAPMASLLQRKLLDPSLVSQALELVRAHDINILQSHGYKSHLLCWLLRRKTGLPWLAFVHGWTRENMRIRLYTALEHCLLLRADEVVAVSESLRSRLLPPVRKRCRVIANALALEEMTTECSRSAIRKQLGYNEEDLVIGIVGRLSPEKGHKLFLHALAAARQKEPRLRGLIVGDGQERAALVEEVKQLGLENFCLFTGHVSKPAPYYLAMDIQAMPSFTEGMPNAALEGMSMGLPLVATRVGGIPEVLVDKETGILIPPDHEKAFIEAILALAASPEQREAMGRAALERIQSVFSPDVRANRILDLYREILEQHKELTR